MQDPPPEASLLGRKSRAGLAARMCDLPLTQTTPHMCGVSSYYRLHTVLEEA